MRKQNAAPMIADISSKDGTRMANTTIKTVTPSRKIARKVFVKKGDWLNLLGLMVAARGSMRETTSKVLTIGAQLEHVIVYISMSSECVEHLLQRKFCQGHDRDQHFDHNLQGFRIAFRCQNIR